MKRTAALTKRQSTVVGGLLINQIGDRRKQRKPLKREVRNIRTKPFQALVKNSEALILTWL